MVSTSSTTDTIKWRFIPPYNAAATAPAAPINLSATAGTNQISLSWNPGGGSVASYSVYRGTNTGGNFSLIASNVVSPSRLDTNVVSGKTYYYVVTAWDVTGGESLQSDEASATPVSPLPTSPTNLTFTVSNAVLRVSWPSNYTGWLLQSQTNPLATGLRSNWSTIPGSETNFFFDTPLNSSGPAVFFRLKRP